MSADVQTELRRLLTLLFDGALGDSDRGRLESLLASDTDARRLYLEYADVHARLLVRHTPPAVPAPPRSERPFRRARYALVAGVTLALSLLLQLFLPRPPAEPLAKTSNAVPAADYVATLSHAAECEWEQDRAGLCSGARLPPGEYRLRAGVARFQFDSGPALTLQGPATLRLESAVAAALPTGRVVFADDETTSGFELHTPHATLADIGTEYAVAVGPEGEEVHVFDGTVVRSERTGDRATAERLAAGQARRYGPGPAASGAFIRLDPGRFARRLPQSLTAPDPLTGLLAYEGFSYTDAGGLQLGTANGGTGWGGPWKPGFARPADDRGRSPLNVTEGLTRPGVSVPPVGGCFDFVGFAKYYRRLKTPVRLDADGVYYLSFLVRRHGPPADPLNAVSVLLRTGDELERDESGEGADLRARLNIGIDKTNDLFAYLGRRGSRVPLPLTSGETYLLTAKIVASRAHPDQVFVRVYGPDEAVDRGEPAAWSATGRPIETDLVFEWLEVHINSKTRQSVDEVRIGTTWSSVAGCWTTPAAPSP
ncbi:hypothetical protein [Limnoglobus roseus]|uniref:Iron dicitrate transport regulator FecR n=1 Tax=Limnoglobus roseus TaxID=2598579 RepID=A0A5C1A896_9BACT|nr:hypothetical protein [Limnoglobus roseus]QEL14970.1 iron dicitrate transport regulator FecR [Limnoglobus roseus]